MDAQPQTTHTLFHKVAVTDTVSDILNHKVTLSKYAIITEYTHRSSLAPTQLSIGANLLPTIISKSIPDSIQAITDGQPP